MIVDSSALIAILRDEADGEALLEAIVDAPEAAISVAGLLESGIVARAIAGDAAEAELDALVARLRVRPVPVDLRQAEFARMAYRTYGRASGHPAKLNFGDCFAYALAKATGRSLLFKGADFTLTDIEPALPARL